MTLWKKVTTLYPLSLLGVTTLYTLETLSLNRTQASADSLVFIVFVLAGVPLSVLVFAILTVVAVLTKRNDIAKASAVAGVCLPLGVISGVFLTGVVLKALA